MPKQISSIKRFGRKIWPRRPLCRYWAKHISAGKNSEDILPLLRENFRNERHILFYAADFFRNNI